MIIRADDLQKEIVKLDNLLKNREPGLISWSIALLDQMNKVEKMIHDAKLQDTIFLLGEDHGEEREASERDKQGEKDSTRLRR